MVRVLKHKQTSPPTDEVRALMALVAPILTSLLDHAKGRHVSNAGGRDKIPLDLFVRLHREGHGDCGVCFEYAVHDAIVRGDALVLDRVESALKLCKIPGETPRSLLFGLEKSGSLQIIDAARKALTDESQLQHGRQGRPIKLKRHLSGLALAFRNAAERERLPYSISGLWKADQFFGTERDQWVGTTVKLNANELAAEPGLRVGIYPSRQGQSDAVRKDAGRNLILCPIGYDNDFMELFYDAWVIVRAFMQADAEMPSEAVIPKGYQRYVARFLYDRRKSSVVEVIDALQQLGQSNLIQASGKDVNAPVLAGEAQQEIIFAPMPKAKGNGD